MTPIIEGSAETGDVSTAESMFTFRHKSLTAKLLSAVSALRGDFPCELYAIALSNLLLLAGCSASVSRSAPQEKAPQGMRAEVVPAAPPVTTTKDEKSYVLPAVEILGFQAALNLFDRNFGSDRDDYKSDLHSIRDNLDGGWTVDRDKFDINQVGHPYQGSIYFNIARSNGLNFWESLGYTTVGSAVWEVAGETTKPSINDQITTTFGGSFLGEALFRTAQTFFASAERTDSTLADIAGSVVSPSAGVNREALDTKTPLDLHRKLPAQHRQLDLGWFRNEHVSNPLESNDYDRDVGMLRFAVDYGLPGRSSYDYVAPFDYFRLDVGLSTSASDAVDHLIVNGLLLGRDFDSGDKLRGIFGVFGNYTYVSPEIFRVASSAVSLGSVAQMWLEDGLALQGSVFGGVGYGAGGTIHSTDGERDYHYGAVPQAQAALRFIVSDRASVGVSGANFFVTGENSDESGTANENIADAQVDVTVRLFGPHALTLSYEQATRDAAFASSPDQHQRVESFGLLYSYLFGGSLGAVDWKSTAH